MLSHSLFGVLFTAYLGVANAQKEILSPIYRDYQEFLSDSKNIVNIAFLPLQSAQKTPNVTKEVSVNGGYDWTKPYSQAAKIVGHKAHLRVAYDVPVPEKVVHNSTTSVSSLTFSVPKSMVGSDGLPKPMDPSWAICRHIFISITADASKTTTSDSCSFLPQKCLADLKDNLTKKWWKEEPGFPCSQLGFDVIAPSCQEVFGVARGDVLSYDSKSLENKSDMKAFAVDEESEITWRIGTEFYDKGTQESYSKAAKRTFLIADVWGSSDKSGGKIPDATFTCLSAKPDSVKSGSGKTPPMSTSSTSDASGAKQTQLGKSTTQSSSGNKGAAPPSLNPFAQNPRKSGSKSVGIIEVQNFE